MNRDKAIVRTSVIGILANVLLASFKAVVGVLTHSIAITMDAVNNLSDALSSVITIVGTRLAGKKPDKKHPWGHGRVEYLSAMGISIIIIYAGLTALIESVQKILHPETPEYTKASLLIVAVAVVTKILLGRYVKSVGEKVDSEALVGSGQDALMDAVISLSTLVAAMIFIGTGISLEAPLGAVISVVIIKAGVDMIRSTVSEILGERVDIETARKVKELLASFPEVHGVYDLIFHDYGPGRLNCSAHVEVDDTLTATQIDAIQRSATMALYQELGIVLTALSVYAVNTTDEKVMQVRKECYRIASQFPHVIEVHGFYMDKQSVQFDVIISFDASDREAVFRDVEKAVKEAYPQYDFFIQLDTDFSVTE